MVRYPHKKNKEILITRIIYPHTTLRVQTKQKNKCTLSDGVMARKEERSNNMLTIIL